MDFAEVEREVTKLRQDVAAGRLAEDQFKARLREMMVEDEEGNWWMVGYETSEWYRHDGTDWVTDQPPGHTPSAAMLLPTLPKEVLSKPAPQPAARQAVSHLNFYRELGLALLGAALFGWGNWLPFSEDFPVWPFAFIPSLLGVLLGPWTGGFAGALGGWILGDGMTSLTGGEPWFFALCGFALGVLPSLLVKDARDWKAVLMTGIEVAVICALIIAVAFASAQEDWESFWDDVGRMVIVILPPNTLLLPLFARWLVGPVRRWGLYWRDRS